MFNSWCKNQQISQKWNTGIVIQNIDLNTGLAEKKLYLVIVYVSTCFLTQLWIEA